MKIFMGRVSKSAVVICLGITTLLLFMNSRRHEVFFQTIPREAGRSDLPTKVNRVSEIQPDDSTLKRNAQERKVAKPQESKQKETFVDSSGRKILNLKRYEISGSVKHNFSYCMVYKAATTSWLRIIRFLNGEDSEVFSPYHIGKHRVHYYKIGKYIKYFNFIKHKDFIENSLRIMAVRDPYTRLWSAYIDKFLLPDFWKSRGNAVIRLVRENRIRKQSLQCGHDVTFKEFIDYVVYDNGAMKAWDQDKHWLPATAMCRLDIFKPHFIMKQENLGKEMPEMLRRLNLTWVEERMKKLNLTEFEMKDQVNYVFKIGGLGCADNMRLAELIWTAFQYNAYIPADIKFPAEKFKGKIDAAKMIEVLNEVRVSWKVSKAERKKQKRDAMVTAYATIPRDTLNKLRDIYIADFETFGYESQPSDIFN